MMMIPRRKDFDILEDIFKDPIFNVDESKIMKTDIKEHENNYSIVVDLPGYNKEDIKVSVEDGYLTIHATMNSENEEKEKGKFVKCPLIKESPVSIECKVVEIKELGSHDMFMAEILSIDADEKYIDNKGAFDITKCDLITYANGKYFTLGKQVGKFGYSVQKKKQLKKYQR